MCSDVGEGSRLCAFYSATGFLFTMWVGVMIHTQAFFIPGIEDAHEARTSAFGAMGMFLVTFIASIGGIYYDNNKQVDEGDAEGDYQLSHDDLPNYGTSA